MWRSLLATDLARAPTSIGNRLKADPILWPDSRSDRRAVRTFASIGEHHWPVSSAGGGPLMATPDCHRACSPPAGLKAVQDVVMKLQLLQRALRDERSGRVMFVSHGLLNQNRRYLGGASRRAH